MSYKDKGSFLLLWSHPVISEMEKQAIGMLSSALNVRGAGRQVSNIAKEHDASCG